jgi:lysyl-tRNA synthetase class 2
MIDPNDNPLRAEKRKKLHAMREQGINPFPYSFERNASLSELVLRFKDKLQPGDHVEGESFQVAGRLMTMRSMGKASFFNIQDQTGTLQVYVKVEELSEMDRKAFDLIDLGDIVGVQGSVFKTKRGELSLHVKNFSVLCKGLEPLPEKFHGIADVEIKYRHRHLDLITDEDSRKVFLTRSKIIKEIRNFLDQRGFLEVETPVLQPIYGGAAAHPFSTHHRALDMKLFMKISPELYLKRLIVGGFEKVYEIGKNFRNEGIDRSHNPEFTMLEFYEAYTDYNYQMKQFSRSWFFQSIAEPNWRAQFHFQHNSPTFPKDAPPCLAFQDQKYTAGSIDKLLLGLEIDKKPYFGAQTESIYPP